MARTTLKIPDELLKQAKIEASQRDKPVQEIVADALRQRYSKVRQATGKYLFYDKDLGVRGTLRREDIYEDVK